MMQIIIAFHALLMNQHAYVHNAFKMAIIQGIDSKSFQIKAAIAIVEMLLQ
jgi:hypothetical protein